MLFKKSKPTTETATATTTTPSSGPVDVGHIRATGTAATAPDEKQNYTTPAPAPAIAPAAAPVNMTAAGEKGPGSATQGTAVNGPSFQPGKAAPPMNFQPNNTGSPITHVAPLHQLLRQPTPVRCPNCDFVGVTRMEKETSSRAGTWALILCLCLGPLCAIIPLVMDDCKDAVHQCARCGVHLGTVDGDGVVNLSPLAQQKYRQGPNVQPGQQQSQSKQVDVKQSGMTHGVVDNGALGQSDIKQSEAKQGGVEQSDVKQSGNGISEIKQDAIKPAETEKTA